MRRIARDRAALFPVNVWPAMVDALTAVAAVFVLVVVLAVAVQRGIIQKLRAREAEVASLKTDKAKIEQQLAAVSGLEPRGGSLIIEEGRVILQGELLFDSGSDAIHGAGRAALGELAARPHPARA